MSKKFCDWEDLYKSGTVSQIHGLSKPLGKPLNEPTLKKGEVPRRPTDQEIRNEVLRNMPKQPTNKELFGHLVPSEETLKKADDAYNNCFNKFYNDSKKPIENQQSKDNGEWGMRKSIYENMSEKEKKERFAYAKE